MLDTFKIYTDLKENMEEVVAEKIAGIFGLVYEELRQSVTKTEFNELKGIVQELAQAQNRTEQRVEELTQAQKELTQAQKHTEQRVEELAQAQDRTEQQIKQLVQAQNRTEQRVEELTLAQEKTEKTVNQLAKQVGGLSEVMGGNLEDTAYLVLHEVLKREFGWEVGMLERVWQNWGREMEEEIDIFGQAMNPNEPDKTIWIVSEAKHNISLKEVKKFQKQVERAKQHLKGEIFPVIFCYRAHPKVQQIILDANIRLVFSYGKLL